jgi:hypothetical protein
VTRSGRRRAEPTPGQRREAGPVGANPLDMAQEPGPLEGEGSSEVAIDVPGAVCDVHRLQDEAGASRHLRMEGCRRHQETVWERVCVGARDVGKGLGVAQADGPSCPDDRRALGENLGPLESRAYDGLPWRGSTTFSRP